MMQKVALKGLRFSSLLLSVLLLQGCGESGLAVTPIGTATGLTLSSNYAGYQSDFSAKPKATITLSYSVPVVHCVKDENSHLAVWSGMGPARNTFFQLGTDSKCVSGSPKYFALWEICLTDNHCESSNALRIMVGPGHKIQLEIDSDNTAGTYKIKMNDVQSPPSPPWSKAFLFHSDKRTAVAAEALCIVEAPLVGQSLAPLARFDPIALTCLVDGLSINAVNGGYTTQSNMIYAENPTKYKATPSSVDAHGLFTVTWHHA